MFVAINRFVINPGRDDDWEAAWRRREVTLRGVPGFVRFSLLRGDHAGEYLSHSTWESRSAFEAWTKSEQFRSAHGQTAMGGILAVPPKVSLYEAVVQQEAALAG